MEETPPCQNNLVLLPVDIASLNEDGERVTQAAFCIERSGGTHLTVPLEGVAVYFERRLKTSIMLAELPSTPRATATFLHTTMSEVQKATLASLCSVGTCS